MSRNLVKRSDKKAFWGIPAAESNGTPTFTRMKGFTELSGSKNPTEYSRQYVDETFESTDVTGYSPSWGFTFDEFTGDLVLEDIVSILDGEIVGTAAQRDIVFVNFTKPVTGGGYEAVKRTFAIIGDSEGDSTDAYTYSGNLRVVGEAECGVATISTPEGGTPKEVQTIAFAKSAAAE